MEHPDQAVTASESKRVFARNGVNTWTPLQFLKFDGRVIPCIVKRSTTKGHLKVDSSLTLADARRNRLDVARIIAKIFPSAVPWQTPSQISPCVLDRRLGVPWEL